MAQFLFLKLCVLSFCTILFASDASFEDGNESSSSVYKNDDTRKFMRVSPERPLMPERGCIRKNNFALLFIKPEYADPMAKTYADPIVMKYWGNGETLSVKQVKDRFSSRAAILFCKQNLKSYYWVVFTRDGICGVVTAFATGTEGVLEVSFLLASSMQGRKQSKCLLETMCEYLPSISWKATSHLENVPSYKSLESAGFLHQKTEYVKNYNAFRKYYSRPSNEQLENKEKIYFPYSDTYIPLSELLASVR